MSIDRFLEFIRNEIIAEGWEYPDGTPMAADARNLLQALPGLLLTVDRRQLTTRQAAIFEFIRQYHGEYGFPPTLQEIGNGVGLSSKSEVNRYLGQLEKIGLIDRPLKYAARGIKITRRLV